MLSVLGTRERGLVVVQDSDETDRLPQPAMSGDPLLKRLVDLAHIGFSARLVLISNGQLLSGRLISPDVWRAALAESIRDRERSMAAFATLDEMVAAAIEAQDAGPTGLGRPDVPDPGSSTSPTSLSVAIARPACPSCDFGCLPCRGSG